MYFETLPQQVWTTLMLAISGFALLRGGGPERVFAVANVLAAVLSAYLQDRAHWLDPQWGMLAVDVGFLALLLTLAIWTDRSWLLFAAAFQLLGVVTHLAIIADPGVRAGAYMRGLVIWSYLVLGSLVVGVWLHVREGSAAGPARR